MASTLFVDELKVKFQKNKSAYADDHIVEANYNSMLIGPINLSGSITVQENAALTVFGEVSVTGTLDVDGTLDIR
jgi:hypothetical protein